MPKHAAKSFGPFIRQTLSKCPDEAAAHSKRLSSELEGSWSGTAEIISPVNIPFLLPSFQPKSIRLTEIADGYPTFREIDQRPPRTALAVFISLAGDRDVSEYTREDAKLFVRHLEMRGNRTATIRRRINSLSAILNHAYAELDLDKRNPFSRLIIKAEGEDSQRTLHLVGYGKLAMEEARKHSDGEYLLPRYIEMKNAMLLMLPIHSTSGLKKTSMDLLHIVSGIPSETV